MAARKLHYILFNKPSGVLSQFSGEGDRKTLRDFGPFPDDVYPVGRLDADSEGLIFLTNDNSVKYRLSEPKFDHPRSYVVQVERLPSEHALVRLRSGVMIEGKKTKPAEVQLLSSEPALLARTPQIRFRKNVPTCWLKITLREGRNRQVRKMTAAIGHPTLRLVRTTIGILTLKGLLPGQNRILSAAETKALRQELGLQE